MTAIDPDIVWYYNKGKEAGRLADRNVIEAERTRRLIAKHLDEAPLSIADIGGAAGAYAFWLAKQGHAVHLVDPIALHLEQARTVEQESGQSLAGIHLAGAEDLPFKEDTFDAALFMGPLYHLIERSRRIHALNECRRVLRPGGKIFAVAITRYGTVVEGFLKDYISMPHYAERMRNTLATGIHKNPDRENGLFTTSYFHKPAELQAEMKEAGFENIELLTVEGPWSCIPGFDDKWKQASFRNLLLETIEAMESDPSVIGFGGHLMGVGVAGQG